MAIYHGKKKNHQKTNPSIGFTGVISHLQLGGAPYCMNEAGKAFFSDFCSF